MITLVELYEINKAWFSVWLRQRWCGFPDLVNRSPFTCGFAFETSGNVTPSLHNGAVVSTAMKVNIVIFQRHNIVSAVRKYRVSVLLVVRFLLCIV